MSEVIRWEDPPSNSRVTPRRPWAVVAVELRARPKEWALIENNSGNSTLADRINKGKSWWAPAGSFEAVTRFIEGRLHTYARYVGDQ